MQGGHLHLARLHDRDESLSPCHLPRNRIDLRVRHRNTVDRLRLGRDTHERVRERPPRPGKDARARLELPTGLPPASRPRPGSGFGATAGPRPRARKFRQDDRVQDPRQLRRPRRPGLGPHVREHRPERGGWFYVPWLSGAHTRGK